MISLEKQGNVFILRMQNGENRYNPDTIRELHGALDEVEAADDPVALVTIGEGKFYSNGLDLDWMSKAGAKAAFENIGLVHGLLARLLGFPCVTVAALNGHAFAAGAMVALAHDFRVMRNDRGYFCLPEVDIGMTFTPSMESLIKARLSKATAHEAMVTGRRYTSAEALAASIVQQSVGDAEVLPASIELASKHTKSVRTTLTGIKRSLYKETLDIMAKETQPQ